VVVGWWLSQGSSAGLAASLLYVASHETIWDVAILVDWARLAVKLLLDTVDVISDVSNGQAKL